jgi:glycosyltransferase involved in cell wall biosynthesis
MVRQTFSPTNRRRPQPLRGKGPIVVDVLRVLHVVPYYDPAWAYGGIPRAATTLARALAERGHHVTVLTTDAATAASRLHFPRVRTCDGVCVRTFPNLSNALAYRFGMFLPLGLAKYLRAHAHEFDVAHLHACHNVPVALAARHLARASVPWVLSPHGTAPFIERRRRAKRIFDRTLGRIARERAAAIVAVGDAEIRQLMSLGVGRARIRVIPPAVDVAEFDTPPARAIARERRVLFLGKLTPRKRVDTLVRAFRTLDDDTRLVVAGSDMGVERATRRLVADLGLDARTTFTGLVTGRERVAALVDADVVSYAGEHEIFGLVPLEALLVGTPVVVADDSGCGDVIRDVGGGLVVPPGDVAALAAAIRNILGDVERWRAAARDAAARVRARFAPERIAADTEALYRDVLAATRDAALVEG